MPISFQPYSMQLREFPFFLALISRSGGVRKGNPVATFADSEQKRRLVVKTLADHAQGLRQLGEIGNARGLGTAPSDSCGFQFKNPFRREQNAQNARTWLQHFFSRRSLPG